MTASIDPPAGRSCPVCQTPSCHAEMEPGPDKRASPWLIFFSSAVLTAGLSDPCNPPAEGQPLRADSASPLAAFLTFRLRFLHTLVPSLHPLLLKAFRLLLPFLLALLVIRAAVDLEELVASQLVEHLLAPLGTEKIDHVHGLIAFEHDALNGYRVGVLARIRGDWRISCPLP